MAQESGQRNGSPVREIIKSASAFGLPGVATPTMLALPEHLSFEEWEDVGRTLGRIDSGKRWWVGDWLNYGEKKYGQTYSQGMEATGLSYDSVSNCAWMARKFPITRRREHLSWSHHEVVSKFEPDVADALLDLAGLHGWDRKELREYVESLKNKDSEPTGATVTMMTETATTIERTTVQVIQPMSESSEVEQSYSGRPLPRPCACHCHTLVACGCEG